MAANEGIVCQNPYETKFQLKEGMRLEGMDPSMAGKLVEMTWNEAMLAQAQGFGTVDIGYRPHLNRPHLLGKKAPECEAVEDGAEQARQRLIEHSRKKNSASTSASSGQGHAVASGILILHLLALG